MGIKIAIADDSTIVRQQVAYALVQVGYDVIEAADGQEAFERISAAPNIKLLICDVNMPRMNGLELLAKLAGPAKSPPFPIVMLTTDGHPELIAQARALGAKGWMVKPVQPEILVATVKKLTGT